MQIHIMLIQILANAYSVWGIAAYTTLNEVTACVLNENKLHHPDNAQYYDKTCAQKVSSI